MRNTFYIGEEVRESPEAQRRQAENDANREKWERFNEPRLDGEPLDIESPVQMFRRRAKDEMKWTRILMYQAANYMERLEWENAALKETIREMETR